MHSLTKSAAVTMSVTSMATWRCRPAAAPAVRGEALATLFFVSYVGLILPTLALGIASRFVDARTSMLWFGAVMLLLAAGVGILARGVQTRSA